MREDAPGDRRLVAYVVMNSPENTATADLRGFLKQKLPEYMLPTSFVLLEKLPITPSGKVDRKSLPAPDTSALSLRSSYVAPRTDTEQQVSQIWSQILKLDKIGIHDNFFELGGYSLLGTQILTRVRKIFAINIPLKVLFESPNITEFANRIDTLYLAVQIYQMEQDSNPAIEYEEGEL